MTYDQTNSEPEKPEKTVHQQRLDAQARGEVLGVLTGQVPVRSAPVAMGKPVAMEDIVTPLHKEAEEDEEDDDGESSGS